MISLLLFLLAGLTVLLLTLGRRRSAAVAGLLLGLAGMGFAGGAVTAPLVGALQEETADAEAPAWCRRNDLILLGAGNLRSPDGRVVPSVFGLARIEAAARAYRACRQSGALCRIVASGGDPQGLGVSEAALMGRQLAALGVPPADILLEAESRNTWENAALTAALLGGGPVADAHLVTSALHMRRARLYFRHFGIDAAPLPADWTAVPAWSAAFGINLALSDLAAHELVGLLRYRVYNALGWNPPPRPLGRPLGGGAEPCWSGPLAEDGAD